MSFGTSSQIINADRVTILRGATEVTLTSDVKVKTTRITDRIYTRAGAIDTFRWRLQEIEFTAALTELLKTQIQTDETIDANSSMTYTNWTVTGISISGSAGDNTSDVLSATVIDSEDLGPENGIAQLRIKLRIIGAAN